MGALEADEYRVSCVSVEPSCEVSFSFWEVDTYTE